MLHDSLRIIKTTYITREGKILEENDLSQEELQMFRNEFEIARIRHKVRWREFDERYDSKP